MKGGSSGRELSTDFGYWHRELSVGSALDIDTSLASGDQLATFPLQAGRGFEVSRSFKGRRLGQRTTAMQLISGTGGNARSKMPVQGTAH